MKDLMVAGMLLSAWVLLEAQAPEKFSYQAVVRDASNNLVVNQTVGLQITIRQGMPGGTEVYQETHMGMTNANGLVSLEIGGGMSTMVGLFEDIDWGDGPYFLQTEVDPAGGTDYTIMGTSQLLSVPYALYAGNVKKYKIGDRAFGGIIFWLEECGQHGLVSDTADISVGISWSSIFSLTNAIRNGLYAGEHNTERIIFSLGAAINAAQICANHKGSGYGDWYLPSIDELQVMYNSIGKGAVGDLNNIGGFFESSYWSSTEELMQVAWYLDFSNGNPLNFVSKNVTFRVRAVRAF